ncbi:MAG: TonB-dependent receptor, partial [Betaproteobacteria bacterium]
MSAAQSVFAQTAADTKAKEDKEKQEAKGQAVEKITVTGSRIVRDTFNSVSPIQIITRDETTLSGFSSATDALQGTAVTAGGAQINNAFGGFVTNGGPGANTLSLRGLGATRTLILLNGRRVSPAGSRGSVGSADLNVLPSSIVDHIEILKDGASSIYGSDAVAGVVNIVTRKNLNGFVLDGQYNTTEGGGGEQKRLSVAYGGTGDNWYLTGSAELYGRKELTLGQRDWTSCQTDYRRTSVNGVVGAWGSADPIDPLTGKSKCFTITGTGNNGVTINTIGTGTIAGGVGAAGSVGTSFNRWRPNSSVTTGLVGFEGVGGGANSLAVRDTFDKRMLQASLITPVDTKTAFVQGGYDIHALGNGEVYFEALVNNRKSYGNSFRQLSLDYARGSPLLPANLSATPVVQSAPTLITNGAALQVRAFIGFGIYRTDAEVDYNKATAGLKGSLPWSDWTYDASFSQAKSDASYSFDQFLTNRLAQSLDVVASGGGFVCRNTANGCVAAPALSTAVIGGVLPQQWLDFVYKKADTGTTVYKESTANFNTGGTLFSMPYGKARGAFGAEYRRAEINDTPSDNMQTGNVYNFSSATITRGKDSVRELYGELEFPLLAGLKGAEELTANVSGRWTDYKSYGSDTTYKIGLLYTPIKSVTFRASEGTSYRAPALFEQFLGSTSGFLSATGDPCNNYASGDPTSVRSKNCASEGLPGNFNATSSIQSNTIGGAAAGLKAETSKNRTIGLVLQPALPAVFGDISFAVDYFDIKVDNGVSRVGTAGILTLCYNDPAFSSGGGFCRLVTRAPAGSNRALIVNDSYINLSTDIVRGFDFTVRYNRTIGPGQLRVNALVTQYKEQSNRVFPTDPLLDSNGQLRAPKMTGTLDLNYKVKGWTAHYGLDWIDATDSYAFYQEDPATSTYKLNT